MEVLNQVLDELGIPQTDSEVEDFLAKINEKVESLDLPSGWCEKLIAAVGISAFALSGTVAMACMPIGLALLWDSGFSLAAGTYLAASLIIACISGASLGLTLVMDTVANKLKSRFLKWKLKKGVTGLPVAQKLAKEIGAPSTLAERQEFYYKLVEVLDELGYVIALSQISLHLEAKPVIKCIEGTDFFNRLNGTHQKIVVDDFIEIEDPALLEAPVVSLNKENDGVKTDAADEPVAEQEAIATEKVTPVKVIPVKKESLIDQCRRLLSDCLRVLYTQDHTDIDNGLIAKMEELQNLCGSKESEARLDDGFILDGLKALCEGLQKTLENVDRMSHEQYSECVKVSEKMVDKLLLYFNEQISKEVSSDIDYLRDLDEIFTERYEI